MKWKNELSLPETKMTADFNANEVPPMPKIIQGFLAKKVESTFTKLFKQFVKRWCCLDLEKGSFWYNTERVLNEKNAWSLKKFEKDDLINFSAGIEYSDPLMKEFSYGFKLSTTKRVYYFYLNEKEAYDQWLRGLNYYFYGHDILSHPTKKDEGRYLRETKIETVEPKKQKIQEKEKEKEKEIEKEKEKPEEKIIVKKDEDSQLSKKNDSFMVENLVQRAGTKDDQQSKKIQAKVQEEKIEEKFQAKAEEAKSSFAVDFQIQQNEDLNKKHVNVTRRIVGKYLDRAKSKPPAREIEIVEACALEKSQNIQNQEDMDESFDLTHKKPKKTPEKIIPPTSSQIIDNCSKKAIDQPQSRGGISVESSTQIPQEQKESQVIPPETGDKQKEEMNPPVQRFPSENISIDLNISQIPCENESDSEANRLRFLDRNSLLHITRSFISKDSIKDFTENLNNLSKISAMASFIEANETTEKENEDQNTNNNNNTTITPVEKKDNNKQDSTSIPQPCPIAQSKPGERFKGNESVINAFRLNTSLVEETISKGDVFKVYIAGDHPKIFEKKKSTNANDMYDFSLNQI